MIIVKRKTDNVVVAFLGEYNLQMLEESDILSGTDMQGLPFEETNASERFELLDALTVFATPFRKYWLTVILSSFQIVPMNFSVSSNICGGYFE